MRPTGLSGKKSHTQGELLCRVLCRAFLLAIAQRAEGPQSDQAPHEKGAARISFVRLKTPDPNSGPKPTTSRLFPRGASTRAETLHCHASTWVCFPCVMRWLLRGGDLNGAMTARENKHAICDDNGQGQGAQVANAPSTCAGRYSGGSSAWCSGQVRRQHSCGCPRDLAWE